MTAELSPRLRAALVSARRVVAFTGAGISAESGVPTFRSPNGIWAKFKPEELASMDGFLRNPDLVWEWYEGRKSLMAAVEPNAGHRALVRMEAFFAAFAIVTQNIDNLHARAGSSTVLELHGNIERNYCIRCRRFASPKELASGGGVPRCVSCGGMIRPDVVWFGEMLPQTIWDDAVEATRRCDVFLSIGTSAVVYPAASLPELALESGATVVEVNPEPTPLTGRAQEFLQGPAGEILPALAAFLERER
jgi:NAD-dependent deacetylase